MVRMMIKRNMCLWLWVPVWLLCAQPADARSQTGLTSGQTVYIPVYSHIYQGDRERPVYLAVTLSIRNVDPDNSLTVLYADYHDSKGALLKKYQEKPVLLAPSSSIRHVVAESDKAGGSGAFFRVAWQSERPVNLPILESIMIGTKSQQGISFTSRGQIISEKPLTESHTDAYEKILQVATDWVPALTSGNMEKAMSFYAEDALVAGGDRNAVYVGLKKIRELISHYLDNYRVTDCSLHVRTIMVDKGWAELRGKFKALWKPKEKGIPEEKEYSNYIWVLKRQDSGSWKIARFLFYPAE